MESKENPRKRVRRSRAEIDELLAAFERWGSTQEAFCREHGLSVATFSSWRRKAQAAAAEPAPKFREVRVTGSPAGSGPAVRLPGGMELFFPGNSSAAEIAALVAALQEVGAC